MLNETVLKVKFENCDTWDRCSNDHDDTCMKMFTNFCVGATDVHRAKTTHAHKDKP